MTSITPSIIQGSPILEQIVLQPTSFCNIDCKYCYLPDREKYIVMSPEIPLTAMKFAAWTGWCGAKVDVRWHAGEPLTAGIGFYQEAFSRIGGFDDLPEETEFSHSIQTNGILLNDEWCDFFEKYKFRIGVSIDGPERIHDSFRHTKSGKGTFKKVMQGIKILQERKIDFDTISVITPQTLAYPEEFYDFFNSLGTRVLGLNIEETEGTNTSSLFNSKDFIKKYRRFVEKLFTLDSKNNSDMIIREFANMKNKIIYGSSPRNTQNEPFAIISIDTKGNISTFSPELLGVAFGKYKNFTFGNILYDSWMSILCSENFLEVNKEIQQGIKNCRESCPYYMFCGGGAPANKLFENGSFQTTETRWCQTHIKVIADVTLQQFESGL